MLLVVVKVKSRGYGTTFVTSMHTHLLHQKLADLRDRTKPWSHQTKELVGRLKEKDIEILDFQLNGEAVVFWILCRCQAAIENVQKLYESNHLMDIFFGFTDIQPPTSEIIRSNVISIESYQFKKTVGKFPLKVHYRPNKEDLNYKNYNLL